MTTLYVLNRTKPSELALCQTLLQDGDALLLIEDAVYLLLAQAERELVQTLDKYPCFALQDDLVARGISARIPLHVTPIGYPDFVALTLQYGRVVNW